MNDALIGRTLGHYRIDAYIASGGMADVYQGVDLRTDAIVAIKTLPAEYARSREMVQRFHQEARSAGALHSPNIVRILDDGIADDIHYIVMEFVTGRSLKEVLDAHGALLPHQVLKIATQICYALNYAHARGVIHRDIKPANIMLDGNDNVIVMDFGIAKAIDSMQLTSTGTAMGTPEYMSPEQIQGKTDFRTDIYSLGVVMYEMVTGRVPFHADTPVAVAYKHTHEDPSPPSRLAPHVPRELETIILKALQKDPDDRYASAQAMYGELPKEVRMTIPPRRAATGAIAVEADAAEGIPVANPFRLIAVLLVLTLALLGAVAYFTILTGHLRVESTPSSATVWIDDGRAGETPLTKRLWLGRHSIHISKQGYGSVTRDDVSIERGKQQQVRAQLPLMIRSTPTGAEIHLDGQVIGKTPLPHFFTPGEHRMVLNKPGYEETTKSFAVSPANSAPLPEFHLAKIPETSTVTIRSSPSGVQAAVDGKARGQTPLRVSLVHGQHHIYLARPGYAPAQGYIQVPEQTEFHRDLKPTRAYGKLAVNALPFAQVFVDGVSKGDTPLVMDRIAVGEHRIRLERPGFRPIIERVSVEPDQIARVGVPADKWEANDEGQDLSRSSMNRSRLSGVQPHEPSPSSH